MHDGGTGVCEYFVIAENAIELYRQMRNRLREILSAVLQQG